MLQCLDYHTMLHPTMLRDAVDCSESSRIHYDMDFGGEIKVQNQDIVLFRICINSMPLVPSFNVSQDVALYI